MSMVIGTNVASLTAQRHLASSRVDMETSMERLASGSKINSAMDDAAGLAISKRMDAQVQGLNQAINNANDGVSMLQTAEGGLEQTTDILLRMRELAVQASSGTYTLADRVNINAEFEQLTSEVTRIAEQTTFNGTSVLNTASGATATDIQVGSAVGDKIGVSFKKMSALDLGTVPSVEVQVGTNDNSNAINTSTLGSANTANKLEYSVNGKTYFAEWDTNADTTMDALAATIVANEAGVTAGTSDGAVLSLTMTAGDEIGVLREVTNASDYLAEHDVLSAANAISAITNIDASIKQVSDYRGDLGAVSNRLTHTVENLMNRVENTSASQSRIQDTDFAVESANLAKAQVLQQAGTAMLAQANQSGQAVLSLLK